MYAPIQNSLKLIINFAFLVLELNMCIQIESFMIPSQVFKYALLFCVF